MNVKETYDKLKKHFQENGYVITYENNRGMSAQHPEKNIIFDQMMEGEYLELSLHLVSDELRVMYDIFDETFSVKFFVENPENKKLADIWQTNLRNEIISMKLEDLKKILHW